MSVYGIDEAKNLVNLDSVIAQLNDNYRYSDIGINTDGTFKTEISITQNYPIWFISRLSFDDSISSDGFINLTNNSGIDLLIIIQVIQRFYSGDTPNLFQSKFFENVYSMADSKSDNNYRNNSLIFFALRNGENLKNKPDEWIGRFFFMYYPMGIIKVRPLFVS